MATEPSARATGGFIGNLYHYTTAESAFEHILPSGRLRMSSYGRMRDPLENRELSFASASETTPTDAEVQFLSHAAWHIDRVRRRMLLLSFTIDAKRGYRKRDEPFMRGWARARMWEQYAANHTGVCLIFCRDSVVQAITTSLNAAGLVLEGNVEYLPRGFADTDASKLDLSAFNPNDLPRLAAFVREQHRALFFTKTLDWEGEHEYRIVHSPGDEPTEPYVFVPLGDPLPIGGVILGERFPEWQLIAAQAACERASAPLYRLTWRGGVPELVLLSSRRTS